MKKSLIALAIASAVSAPAFAATSNVDVYGKINMTLGWFADQPKAISDVQVSSIASRIGFKGNEDLGGGMAAIWQIESVVNLDEQTGTFASRNSFVGLKGGFGTALIGNYDTPLKLVGRAVDLFADTFGDSRNVLGVGTDIRVKNVVAYVSPSWSGFSFAAAYTPDPATTANNGGDLGNINGIGPLNVGATGNVYNFNGTYTNGPVYVGVAYSDGNYQSSNGLGAQYRLAGGFTFGDFKLVGQYDFLNADNLNLGMGMKGDYSGYMVGGSYTMGAMVFKADYMAGDYKNAANPDQWNLGMDYNLSKRTSVYALYTEGKNTTLGSGAGASDQIAGTGCQAVGSCTGVNQGGTGNISAFSLGVSHSF